MIIRPRTRGFICTTAHPVGCATNVNNAIERVQAGGRLPHSPRNVLVIGSSSGYGLASRITVAFAGGAATLGINFEKEPTEQKTASAGWYNSLAFDHAAKKQGLWSKTLNQDAFADQAKEDAIAVIKQSMQPLDLVVYSLASPIRRDPDTGEVHRSVIKPIGEACSVKDLNVDKAEITDEVTLNPASEEEIASTVKVMGGEDWQRWIRQLSAAGVLAKGCRTLAYTYIGSELTWPIYRNGTIGHAKEHLEQAATQIRQEVAGIEGDVRIVALKAVVTQASAAIPVVPLYNSILFRVMKQMQLHEDPVAHIDRLFRALYGESQPPLDDDGRIRMDEAELSKEVQSRVLSLWPRVNTQNLRETTDFAGFRKDFLQLFGFEVEKVDYSADLSPLWQPE